MFPPDVGVDKTKDEMNVLEIIVSECFLNNKISHLLTFPLLKKISFYIKNFLPLGFVFTLREKCKQFVVGSLRKGKKNTRKVLYSENWKRKKGAMRSGFDLCDSSRGLLVSYHVQYRRTTLKKYRKKSEFFHFIEKIFRETFKVFELLIRH